MLSRYVGYVMIRTKCHDHGRLLLEFPVTLEI